MTGVKLGLIFECGPQGADKQVCEYLAQNIRTGVTLTSKTLDNKRNLLRDAGRVAAQLLKDGCHAVFIVWDLRPAWPDKKGKPCRAQERRQVLETLEKAGLPRDAAVNLVCIEQELESWLLACDHALSAFLSTPAHLYKVGAEKKPDRVQQPKAVLTNHFRQARGWPYEDVRHALPILKAADLDLKRLRRSASFARLEAKLHAVPPP